jgi:hypothetical protein
MKARMRVWAVGIAMAMGGAVCCGSARGQGATGKEDGVTTVRGRVLNQVTKEPIGRALVFTAGSEYATMTNDRGEFEFKIAEHQELRNIGGGVAGSGRAVMGQMQAGVGHMFMAKKPGYLEDGRGARPVQAADGQMEVTIHLVPEALIVGHVTVPGSEGDVRIACGLYRREMREGQETWSAGRTVTTWADGEFRFSELKAGTYKLITHEQMDRDSMIPVPGVRLFGYPPIYYPNTTDFSVASAIVVKAGETAQANLTVARREYYPVRIEVRNAPVPPAMNLVVYPMGHHGPGWSLGFNPMEQTIEGLLPDGNFTVEADAFGEKQATGILNFTVKGRAMEGPVLNLIPNASVNVNVHEEFQSEQGGEPMGMSNGQDVQVNLVPLDELGGNRPRGRSRVAEGSDPHTMVIENVRPGRYRVNVFSGKGYAASIECGGSDLKKQPLVVGFGGGTPPIEITMHDDGGEVSGTVEETTGASRDAGQSGESQQMRIVYLLATGEGEWQEPLMAQSFFGTFQFPKVPPGDYVALAYANPKREEDLPWVGDKELEKSLEGLGQKIHVEAGQKVNVKLKVIAGEEE